MIIHVGANHIPHEPPNQVITKLKHMYEEVRSMFPSTYVYHSTMLPRLDNNILHYINLINKEIETYCKTLRMKTIFHPQFGINQINFNILNDDVIHPTFNGTSIMARNIIAVYRNYTIHNRQ